MLFTPQLSIPPPSPTPSLLLTYTLVHQPLHLSGIHKASIVCLHRLSPQTPPIKHGDEHRCGKEGEIYKFEVGRDSCGLYVLQSSSSNMANIKVKMTIKKKRAKNTTSICQQVNLLLRGLPTDTLEGLIILNIKYWDISA